jgi:hypothetical protein
MPSSHVLDDRPARDGPADRGPEHRQLASNSTNADINAHCAGRSTRRRRHRAPERVVLPVAAPSCLENSGQPIAPVATASSSAELTGECRVAIRSNGTFLSTRRSCDTRATAPGRTRTRSARKRWRRRAHLPFVRADGATRVISEPVAAELARDQMADGAAGASAMGRGGTGDRADPAGVSMRPSCPPSTATVTTGSAHRGCQVERDQWPPVRQAERGQAEMPSRSRRWASPRS